MNRPNNQPTGAAFNLAGMSRDVAVLTWLFCILAVAIPVTVFFLAPEKWMSLLLAAILWGTFRFVWSFYRPSRFEINADGLRIVFPWRSLLIPRDEIVETVLLPKGDLGFVIRTCGAGGLWGSFGGHWSRKIGRMLIYSSRSDQFVFIRRGGLRPILITPTDPEQFVEEMRKFSPDRGDS